MLVVCDRAALRTTTLYFFLACGRTSRLRKFVEMWMKTYDLLIRVPVLAEAQDDGFRDTDIVFVSRSGSEGLGSFGREPDIVPGPRGRSGEHTWAEAALKGVLEHPGLRQGRL
jgi:hypothetical protein